MTKDKVMVSLVLIYFIAHLFELMCICIDLYLFSQRPYVNANIEDLNLGTSIFNVKSHSIQQIYENRRLYNPK